MRIGIFTRSLPPHPCGIGDHTVHLGSGLRALGHDVVLLGCEGAQERGQRIVGESFTGPALLRMLSTIDSLELDHLILQFAPQMYTRAGAHVNRALVGFWLKLGARLSTSVIVHETYFRTWRRPLSLVRGSTEKRALQKICRASNHVFTASEPLLAEMAHWGLRLPPILLPISSNIPFAEADTRFLREQYGVSADTTILTLFGGGNNLKWRLDFVDRLERELRKVGIKHAWLLLGGVPRAWLPTDATIINPGRLSLQDLSKFMQMTDVFLMPNWSGVNAKRGTLMAAMEHGLPVVGTRGYMTDPFWSEVKGVQLVKPGDFAGFVGAVVDLATNQGTRIRLGCLNRDYFHTHFARERMAQRVLSLLSVSKSVQ